MNILLHRRLLASQDASPDTIAIDRAIETAICDLKRISRHNMRAKNTGQFTRMKIACVASRLLQAVVSEGVADAVELPADCERSE